MTTTDKPVQRRTVKAYDVLFPHQEKKRRPIVCRIDLGDIIRFREAGRRQWYDLTIPAAFRMAVKGSAGFLLCMVPGPTRRKKKTRKAHR